MTGKRGVMNCRGVVPFFKNSSHKFSGMGYCCYVRKIKKKAKQKSYRYKYRPTGFEKIGITNL